MTNDPKILVVGVGNMLMMDEGIGMYALRELEKKRLPEDVTLTDAGTDIFKIISLDNKYHTVIIIDAIRRNETPGSIYKFSIDEINVDDGEKNVHRISIVEALRLIKFSIENYKNCNMILMGIEPEKIEFGLSLTETVQTKIDTLTELVLKEIENARSVVSKKYN
jgi:hydrogenase maturation protease